MRKICFGNGRGACYAVAFGLGMALSCFCPTGLTLFIMAIIIICLGVSVIRH